MTSHNATADTDTANLRSTLKLRWQATSTSNGRPTLKAAWRAVDTTVDRARAAD
jgi:hypothetical protein